MRFPVILLVTLSVLIPGLTEAANAQAPLPEICRPSPVDRLRPTPNVCSGPSVPGVLAPNTNPPSPALSAVGLMVIERAGRPSSLSLSRHLAIGAGMGGAAGAAFGLAVVGLADCAGSKCTSERVAGVAGHMLAGAAIGALAGGIAYLIRK